MTFQEFKDLLTKPIGASPASNAPGAAAKRPQVLSDVVGIELGGDDARGCPAVRLTRRRGAWSVRALGFVPPPNVKMPGNWKELDNQPTWMVPSAFAAPYAAIAVNSPDLVIRQTTLETLSDGGKKPTPGVPISQDGLRLAVAPLGDTSFMLETGLPEYQVLWLSRLFPEGRRPTACSVQTAPAAMLAAIMGQPELKSSGGNAAALFVTDGAMYFTGFRNGAPVLFRELPNAGGVRRIREALKAGFGMGEDKMVDEMLDDTLVDPAPILEPIANPVLRQLELSLDYLRNRLGVEVGKIFLMGLPSGVRHWSKMSEAMLNVRMVAPGAFEGVDVSVKFDRAADALLARSHVFLSAYGAARAAMEDEA